MKVLIRNVSPSDWILAAKAAKKFNKQEEHSSYIVSYEDGTSFLIERTPAGNISICGEDR